MQARAINFAIERQRHRGFVGRGTLLAQLDQLLVEELADRWVVVTGGPGMGKSALLSAWLARRAEAGDLVPHHFIRRDFANWDDPASLVSSLVAQIEARFPDLPEPEADPDLSPAARLTAMLGRVSEAALVSRGERLVILIDGLDEYDPPPGPPSTDPLGASRGPPGRRCRAPGARRGLRRRNAAVTDTADLPDRGGLDRPDGGDRYHRRDCGSSSAAFDIAPPIPQPRGMDATASRLLDALELWEDGVQIVDSNYVLVEWPRRPR